jgi:hypothetical protein
MQIITTTISFILLIVLIVLPLFLINKLNKLKVKYNFILYLISATIITSILTLFFAWWSHYSDEILLSYYGYKFDSINEFENVSAENLDKVKNLEMSMMGIGWPLKAIISYIIYCPYLLIVYIVAFYYTKMKKKNIQKQLNDIESKSPKIQIT